MAVSHIHPPGSTKVGFEQLTVSTAVKTLTASVYQITVSTGESKDRITSSQAVITVHDQPIRYRVDGTDPDASTGHYATDGDVIYLNTIFQIVNFKAIREGGTDAVIAATYYE